MVNEVQILAFDQDGSIIQGTWIGNVDSSSRFNGYQWNNSNANGDEKFYTKYFAKGGNYKIRLIYLKNINQAKADIGLDSNGSTSLWSQLDMYNSSLTYNNVIEITKEISRGYHDIHVKANGHNASSTGYNIQFSMEFDLIQEYPVYQDDQPATFSPNQKEQLLYKTILQTTASSVTINLADLDLVNKYSEIIVKVGGISTASLVLNLQINGIASGYAQNGWTSIGATLANVSASSAASFQLLGTNILTASQSFWAQCKIAFAVGNGILLLDSEGGVAAVGSTQVIGGVNTAGNNITSITISTSTSTLAANSHIEIWGIKKK